MPSFSSRLPSEPLSIALRLLIVLLGTGTETVLAADPPNVILFIADDVNWNDFGCYGNSAARTPHIDALAANGLCFDHAYLTASSCSPSRSSIMTGRYPHNNGPGSELHQPVSGHLPWFPELLRQAGYYTALSGKFHVKADAARPEPFDLVQGGRIPGNSGGHGQWVATVRDRPADQPFFFWFASYDAHRGWDADKQWNEEKYGPMHRPQDVIVPPWLIDDAPTRSDLASYYNEVTRFDYYIGQVVRVLKEQGVFENTLIMVLADNGRPFPRSKTRLHDSGMKTALVASWPAGISPPANHRTSALTSVVDLAPTILSAAGCDVPSTFQGTSLQPVFQDSAAAVRNYAFSEHNWHDYEAHGRSIRDGRWLLIRNFRPELAWQGPADSVRSPSHQALLSAAEAGLLNQPQSEVLLAPRPTVELYDVAADPFQQTNLAGTRSAGKEQERLTRLLDEWMDVTGDSVPEFISPDTFHRTSGERLAPNTVEQRPDAIPAGADRGADRINAPGPDGTLIR